MKEIGVARKAARSAARTASRAPARTIKEKKEGPVTIADVRAEEAVRGVISRSFPDDSILGEEGGSDNNSADRLWIIDPLDGTVNFIRGSRRWCSAVALLQGGEAICSALARPGEDACWSAERGGGAWQNGRRIFLEGHSPNAESALVVTYIAPQQDSSGALDRIVRATGGLRCTGSGSLDLLDLALGRVDAWIQPQPAVWDWEPGALLVREAGGWSGGDGGWACAARSEELGRAILALAMNKPQ